jgi:hypothetical protein
VPRYRFIHDPQRLSEHYRKMAGRVNAILS